MAKLSRPVLFTALAGIVAVAYVYTQDEPKTGTSKKKTTRSSKAVVAKDKFGFSDEDYNPPAFAPVTFTKNAFQPVIVRTRQAGEIAIAPDAVPAELAGGDPNWFYTGNAELDGKPTALLDNRVTMESEFVAQGQKWKRCTIVQILPQALVLAGPSGRKVKLTLSSGEATIVPGSNSRYASGYQPVNPSLRGPIGNGLGVRPDRTPERNTTMETRDAN